MLEHNAGQRLNLGVHDRLALMFRKVANVGLGKGDVVEVVSTVART